MSQKGDLAAQVLEAKLKQVVLEMLPPQRAIDRAAEEIQATLEGWEATNFFEGLEDLHAPGEPFQFTVNPNVLELTTGGGTVASLDLRFPDPYADALELPRGATLQGVTTGRELSEAMRRFGELRIGGPLTSNPIAADSPAPPGRALDLRPVEEST